MIQFSIYGRILNGTDAEEKHMKRLVSNLPAEGSIRVLTVTEKQYAGMKLLVGLPLFQEKRSTPIKLHCFETVFQNENPLHARLGAGFGGVGV